MIHESLTYGINNDDELKVPSDILSATYRSQIAIKINLNHRRCARNAGPRAGAMRTCTNSAINSLILSVLVDASTAMCCKERLGLQRASCLTERISKLLCCRSCLERHLTLGNIPFAHIFPSGMADGEPLVASQVLRLCCGASWRHSHRNNYIVIIMIFFYSSYRFFQFLLLHY
ncbi:hypothetical protein GGI43DRAFT_363950 [Trichoderma evansii]